MKKSLNKKILFVVPYFAPAWSYGGTVKASFEFSKELINLGHKVTVATTDALDDASRNGKLTEEIDGVKIIRFKNISNALARRFNLYLPIGFKKWLSKNIQNYDLVHIHELFTYQSLVTSLICDKANKPYVVQPHGSIFKVAKNSRFTLIKNLLIRHFPTLILKSRAVIVLNNVEKKAAEEAFPEIQSKIEIVPNGLNLNEFKDIKKVDLHSIYKIPEKDKIIAFMGRIKYVKGLDISIKALSEIKDELNFSFFIIGPDEGEKGSLEALSANLGIEKRIIYTGLLSGRKKLETLKSADISILNSRSEGLPTALLESAALGVPIVCSSSSNLPEVDSFKAGFITDNEHQTAQKIKDILTNSRLRSQLSLNALKMADSYNIGLCAKRLNRIYQSII